MSLLYFASQSGKKRSKLSFVEFEYLRAFKVIGHIPLNTTRVIPSSITIPRQIQVHLSILLFTTAYIK